MDVISISKLWAFGLGEVVRAETPSLLMDPSEV